MIRGFIFDYNRTIYDTVRDRPTPDVYRVLDRLGEDAPLCLISKGGDERREQIRRFGLDQYFIDVQVVEDKRTEHLERCAQLMGMRGLEIGVVGDRVRSEIRLANSLGMFTIWYRRGKFAGELPRNVHERPCAVIHRLDRLFEYV